MWSRPLYHRCFGHITIHVPSGDEQNGISGYTGIQAGAKILEFLGIPVLTRKSHKFQKFSFCGSTLVTSFISWKFRGNLTNPKNSICDFTLVTIFILWNVHGNPVNQKTINMGKPIFSFGFHWRESRKTRKFRYNQDNRHSLFNLRCVGSSAVES